MSPCTHGDIVSTVKLSDAKHYASLLSSFLSWTYLYFGVNDMISFQKLVHNLHKTIAA